MSGSFTQRRREDSDADPWRIQGNPGLVRVECCTQQPLIVVIWSPMCSGSVSTNVNTGGSDAPIAVMCSHDVNSGANGNGACRDSLTSLSEASTRCGVDRNRTAVRRFGNDRIATHARHS